MDLNPVGPVASGPNDNYNTTPIGRLPGALSEEGKFTPMLIGPLFAREALTAPRRPKHYLYRTVYVTALAILMCTCWLVVAGTQVITNVGDMARFGGLLFRILAVLQLALVTFLAAFGAASSVSQEKDRRTLILLMLTRLTSSELVLGKLFGSLLHVLVLVAAAAPLLLSITLFGGVSMGQVTATLGVSLATALAASSLGSTLALWRDKTFQTLAMTAVVLVIWVALWEAISQVGGERMVAGITCSHWALVCSPLRAILTAIHPAVDQSAGGGLHPAIPFMVVASLIAVLLNAIAIWGVRRWNPSRQLRPQQADDGELASIWSASEGRESDAEAARESHVDSIRRRGEVRENSRRVWDNPILWREVCTWAYGRKVLIIRVTYVLLFAMAAAGLHLTLNATDPVAESGLASIVPRTATPLAPFFLVSAVIVNALAVTSVTNERDGLSLDLLLVSDLSPKEFVLGKLWGVFWVTKEMLLLPLALCVYLWWRGGASAEDIGYVAVGLVVVFVFVNMLGIHCGMTYANSRSAIGVSLGAVFFLFLGVITCMMVMLSFSGSFQTQFTSFLAFILGGSVGLYVSLGIRNPSAAILTAALLLPLGTFHAITSFLIQHNLTAFLVISGIYGFTTAAMMMPAIGEFDIAMGRTKVADDE